MKATLKDNFETRTITKTVQGKEVKEVVPRYKKGSEYDVIAMDMFWLTKEEKGGLAVSIAPMTYLRLTYPDGTKTQYHDLFEFA